MAAATVKRLVASRAESKGCQRAMRTADSKKQHMPVDLRAANELSCDEGLPMAGPTADLRAASMEQNWALDSWVRCCTDGRLETE
jgi:hypothetical protein